VIEECTDADEARMIANHYDRIIESIATQMKTQGDAA
jgi:hypothetical protein